MTEKQRKRLKVWTENLRAARQTPGNCSHCGKPHPPGGYCPPCREKQRHRVAKRRQRKLEAQKAAIPAENVGAIAKRMDRLELSLDMLQRAQKKAWQRAYGAGFRHAARLILNTPHYDPPTMTKQELATMNHAYDNGDYR